MSTAVLVDGAFFLRRNSEIVSVGAHPTPQQATLEIVKAATWHAVQFQAELYRTYYYDCAPLLKKVHLPISHQAFDYSRTRAAIFRLELFKCLKRQYKVALRLGHLQDGQSWNLRSQCMKELLLKRQKWENLADSDFAYDIRQKGVDMRIGLDIAALTYKRLVKRIVLIASDSDFVPAAKLARREGIEFILDPMWSQINDSLVEHVDGIRNFWPKPSSASGTQLK